MWSSLEQQRGSTGSQEWEGYPKGTNTLIREEKYEPEMIFPGRQGTRKGLKNNSRLNIYVFIRMYLPWWDI